MIQAILQKGKIVVVVFLLISTFCMASGLLFPTQTRAASPLAYPYGGRTLWFQYCSCTPGCFNILVGPPRPALLMWCPTTITYAWWNIFTPAWQLGMATGYLPCMKKKKVGCYTWGGGMYEIMDGTSVL